MGKLPDLTNDLSRRGFMERLALGGAALSQLQTPAANAQSAGLPESLPWSAPPGLLNPNILVIMVDQMRWPIWLNGAQVGLLPQLLPNIFGRIRNNSYVFQQYYAAANVCTASRGTFVTGLYAPQTFCFTDAMQSPAVPPLFGQFNTFAQGMSALNGLYLNNVWWFGKWHLSFCSGSTPLKNYGFKTRTYPGGAAGNPSPDGSANEGTDGGQYGPSYYANDSDIANDFVGWIKGQAPTSPKPASPWCATVSFVNPHDISRGPAWLTQPYPPAPPIPKQKVSFPPPAFPPPSGAPAMYSVPPSPWNYEDLTQVLNKPAAQYAFQADLNNDYGTVTNWVTFLNWYYWLQNYVDTQVGAVLDALATSSYAANTVVIFTADHGEHGGSHGLHDKGGTAYDETIHVPLYVQFPGRTGNIPMNQMCSSVDIFGLICDLAAHGSGQWKVKYPDLAKRQSFWSFLYKNAKETRIGPTLGVPYILYTCDQTNIVPGVSNNHIVALRTKYQPTNTAQPGAKLGVYSAWEKCTTFPDGTTPDYEFYDYNPATVNNTSELGNNYSSTNPSVTQTQYLAELGVAGPPGTGLIGSELNPPLVGTGNTGAPLTQVQATAQTNYINYLWGPNCTE